LDEFSLVLGPHNPLGSFYIVLNAGSGLSGNPAASAAFSRASNHWVSYFSDPININIDANLASLGSGIIGSKGSVLLQARFNTVRNAMGTDAAGEASNGIVGSLCSPWLHLTLREWVAAAGKQFKERFLHRPGTVEVGWHHRDQRCRGLRIGTTFSGIVRGTVRPATSGVGSRNILTYGDHRPAPPSRSTRRRKRRPEFFRTSDLPRLHSRGCRWTNRLLRAWSEARRDQRGDFSLAGVTFLSPGLSLPLPSQPAKVPNLLRQKRRQVPSCPAPP